MKRPIAILLTLVIVCGIPVTVTEIAKLVVSDDTASLVAVFVGFAFGTFASDIYGWLVGTDGAGPHSKRMT